MAGPVGRAHDRNSALLPLERVWVRRLRAGLQASIAIRYPPDLVSIRSPAFGTATGRAIAELQPASR